MRGNRGGLDRSHVAGRDDRRGGDGRDGTGIRRRVCGVCVAAELAADAGHYHVALGCPGRATRDVPDRAGLAGRARGRAGWPGAVANPRRDLVGGDGGRVDRVRLRRRDRGHDPAARQDRRADSGRRRPRTRRRRVAGGECARDMARRAGPRPGSRGGEDGGGLAAPGPPGRDGVCDGLAQRMGDPGLRTGSDDSVRNQAHGVPQQRPQGQRGHDRLAASRPGGRGRRLSSQRRPCLRPGRHRCGPPLHGEQPSHREACHDALSAVPRAWRSSFRKTSHSRSSGGVS
jgi:hypothetical protein